MDVHKFAEGERGLQLKSPTISVVITTTTPPFSSSSLCSIYVTLLIIKSLKVIFIVLFPFNTIFFYSLTLSKEIDY